MLATALGYTNAQVVALISSRIDEKAADEEISPRAPATPATSVERFLSTNSSSATIPIGQTASTPGLTAIGFHTTVDILSQPKTLDPVSGLYYYDVPIEADVPGTSSRVPIGRVTQLLPALAGFNTCTNIVAASDGTDTETDTSVLNRIVLARKGRELDTVNGLKLLVAGVPGVQSALVLDNTSPYMTRGTGNQVDIRVVGTRAATVTDTIVWNTAMMGNKVILSSPPVLSIIQVKVNGTPTTNFTFVPDTTGISGSVRALDYIHWTVVPTDGDTIEVQYEVNQLIRDIQNTLLGAPLNIITNSDVLIRESEDLPIDITTVVYPQSGYTVAQLSSAITAAVTAYFANNPSGDGTGLLPMSQVTTVIQSVTGVDHLAPFTLFAVHPATGANDVPVNPTQYVTLNNLSF